jgi:hypothetical protein
VCTYPSLYMNEENSFQKCEFSNVYIFSFLDFPGFYKGFYQNVLRLMSLFKSFISNCPGYLAIIFSWVIQFTDGFRGFSLYLAWRAWPEAR